MNRIYNTAAFVAGIIAGFHTLGAGALPAPDTPAGLPEAIVDLRTAEGVALVNGEWRYRDADIIEIKHRSVGPDLKATGPANRTHDVAPDASAPGFDDSGWEKLEPAALEARRGAGRLSFNWHRINITIPEKIGDFDPSGSTAVFEVVMDDYAEVWADGKLPFAAGQSGGPVVAGWNAPNRVVIGRGVRPGQKIQLAVFAMNGPISAHPDTYIWMRSATLDFYKPERFSGVKTVPAEIIKKHPALDAAIPPGAKLEQLATGFMFTEGPVWHPEGYLLFSDPNMNAIYRWSEETGVSVYRTKSGYTGTDIRNYRQPGSNGLALDRQGRLAICEHGNRRVTRLEKNGALTVLADRFEGKRLNSPNDLVYRSDGALYFSDPPFGLPRVYDDPGKELADTPVFCLIGGELKKVSADLKGPNGLALSPDEKFLYVANWDEQRKIVMRYESRADGSLASGTVFFDMGGAPGEEALDGIKADPAGNLFVSGPGGVWVISPGGEHLGTIKGPELPANMAWGDADGRTLYMTARTSLYRMRLGRSGSMVSSAGALGK